MLKKIFYILLFLSVMFCALYTNSSELYIWMYIIAGTPLLSLALLGIATFRIKYTESINEKRVIRGDHIKYHLNLYNEDFFLYPFVQTNFFVDSHISRELFQTGYFFLFPRKEHDIKKEIRCSHTGSFNIGIKEFQLTDYFGFFTLKTHNTTLAKQIYVLPKVHYLARFASVQGNIEDKISVSGEKGILEDYTEIESIYDYRPGIPYKKIHWKATASKDKLLVKEFAHPNDLSVCMYVDINIADYNDEDRLTAKDIVLESALSIAHYVVNKNITCKVMMNDIDMTDRTITTTQDFDGYYDFLSVLSMDKCLSFANMMRNYYNRNFASRDVIIVSGCLTDDLMDLIMEFKTAGINVVLVSPLLGSPEVKKQNSVYIDTLRNKKITVFALSSADDIGTVLQA